MHGLVGFEVKLPLKHLAAGFAHEFYVSLSKMLKDQRSVGSGEVTGFFGTTEDTLFVHLNLMTSETVVDGKLFGALVAGEEDKVGVFRSTMFRQLFSENQKRLEI